MAVLATCLTAAPAIAKHRNWPDLPKHTYKGKPLRVVSIVADDNPSAVDIHKFTQELVVSTWYRDLSHTYDWGTSGIADGFTVKPGDFAPGIKTKTDLSKWIQGEAQAHNVVKKKEVRTLYALFIPKKLMDDLLSNGLVPVDGGTTKCGAGHHFIGLQAVGPPFVEGDAIAVVNACSGSSDVASLDAQTATASHEIAEAGTDTGSGFFLHNPPSDSPWVSGSKSNQETGDMCGGTRTKVSTFAVQRIFSGVSNDAGKDPCIPAEDPYFSVSTQTDWFEVDPGKTVVVPITGWSTAAVADWDLKATDEFCTDGQLTLALSSEKINDGQTVQLTVGRGTWTSKDSHCVVELLSSRAGDEDRNHEWRIGFRPSPQFTSPCEPPKVECSCAGKPRFCTTESACEHVCGRNVPKTLPPPK